MLDVHDNKNNSFNNRLVIAWQATIIVQGAKQATKSCNKFHSLLLLWERKKIQKIKALSFDGFGHNFLIIFIFSYNNGVNKRSAKKKKIDVKV